LLDENKTTCPIIPTFQANVSNQRIIASTLETSEMK
jgi:hypothetical protein